jgi:hypothetical protein
VARAGTEPPPPRPPRPAPPPPPRLTGEGRGEGGALAAPSEDEAGAPAAPEAQTQKPPAWSRLRHPLRGGRGTWHGPAASPPCAPRPRAGTGFGGRGPPPRPAAPPSLRQPPRSPPRPSPPRPARAPRPAPRAPRPRGQRAQEPTRLAARALWPPALTRGSPRSLGDLGDDDAAATNFAASWPRNPGSAGGTGEASSKLWGGLGARVGTPIPCTPVSVVPHFGVCATCPRGHWAGRDLPQEGCKLVSIT